MSSELVNSSLGEELIEGWIGDIDAGAYHIVYYTK